MQVEPHSILVVNASHFGKALLMLPAMQALRQKFPDTFILAAVSKGISELLKVFQLSDETLELGVIPPTEQGLGSAIKRLLRLLRANKGDGFDFVVDFAPRIETQIASRLGWRTRTVTPARFSNLIEVLLKRNLTIASNHAADCAAAVKKIGVHTVAERYDFALTHEDNRRFEEILKRGGFRGAEPVVILHSSPSRAVPQWPLEKFSEIAFRLVNNFEARVVVLDEPCTSDFTKALKTFLPKSAITINAPGAIDFLAALARASLLITDDRGVAKTARDLHAPVIELAEEPSPFAKSTSHRVLRSISRRGVSTEEVYEAACELIQEGRTLSLFQR